MMWRWAPLAMILACGGGRDAVEPTVPADPVWRERIERVVTTLTRDSLVPADPATVTAAGWRALGEPPGAALAERVGSRVAAGTLEPAAAWTVVDAMVVAADDPHTLLFSADGMGEIVGSIGGAAYTAPGAVLHWTPARELVVAEVMPGGPAGEAGLAVGDVVTAVIGAPPRSVWPTVAATFVPEGSEVHFEIVREGAAQTIGYAARRFAHPVSAHRVDGTIGVLRPYFFARGEDPARNTVELARAALADFDRAGVTGIVVDLRGNQGGEGVTTFGGLFTDADPILVSHPAGQPAPEPWPSPGHAWPTRRPLAVLIDEQTISAAEMVALALQVHAGARVIGQPSGGALNVPVPIDLGDGYQLLVPVVPVGRPGADPQLRVEPDHRIPNRTIEELRAGRDPQLEAVVGWLQR